MIYFSRFKYIHHHHHLYFTDKAELPVPETISSSDAPHYDNQWVYNSRKFWNFGKGNLAAFFPNAYTS